MLLGTEPLPVVAGMGFHPSHNDLPIYRQLRPIGDRIYERARLHDMRASLRSLEPSPRPMDIELSFGCIRESRCRLCQFDLEKGTRLLYSRSAIGKLLRF